MKDFLGTEIEVGDTIVYGAALGRSAALAAGVVLTINEGVTGRQARLIVQRTQTQWMWAERGEQLAGKKPVRLMYPDRVAVVRKAGQ